MSAARRSSKKTEAEELSFEEKLARLEELVAALESGELGLEQGVERYREGVELLRVLHESLQSAEQKVEDLTEVLRNDLSQLEQADDSPGGDEPESFS